MAYLCPIHQPSSVRHAQRLNFLSWDEETLVVAKANSLEFYAQTSDGLALRHSKSLYGRVTMLNKVRPASSRTDHLFVGTDQYMYFTLSWDASSNSLKTEKTYEDISETAARDSQSGDRCQISPCGRFMTLELYEGIITVIPIVQRPKKPSNAEMGSLGEPLQARIAEMFVQSSTFFTSKCRDQSRANPTMALLYEDTERKKRLKIKELSFSQGLHNEPGSADFNDLDGPDDELDLGASHLIPVCEQAGGLLIVGETSISYFDDNRSSRLLKRPLQKSTIFISWEQIDNQRYVLADDFGMMYLLMLEMVDRSSRVVGWRIDSLGYTSRASVLVYLGNGQVYVGSHQGDSQVVQIRPGAVEVLQTFPNIAPIVDFTIMDMGTSAAEGQISEYSSGQARLITGSGAFKDGSLRSVRSGVGLEDLGMLGELTNIVSLHALKSQSSSSYQDVLVVSFIDETRIFQFSADGQVEETPDFQNFSLAEPTIYTANLPNGRLVQVTSTVVKLVDGDGGVILAEWKPDAGTSITAATANNDVLIVSNGGTRLVVLDQQHELVVQASRNFDPEHQVACLTVSPHASSFCIVGFWHSSSVSALKLADLQDMSKEIVSEDQVAVPRDLAIVTMLTERDPMLFVALTDGNVVTYSLDPTNGSLSAKKSVALGTQQANFRVLPRDNGLHNIFAICEHPTLVYGSEGRIVFSAVTADNASVVCPLNAEAFPGALAIATPDDLKLSIVDEERSTHVRPMHMGQTVRRIAHSPGLKAFGLGTIQRDIIDNEERVQSYFKLADEVVFNEIDNFSLNPMELVESVVCGKLSDGADGVAERFVVGTAYLDDEENESVRGRILVFEVTEDQTLSLIAERATKGACRCLAIIDGKIVAALIKTVVVYAFEYETQGSPSLSKRASYRTSTAPIDLTVEGNTLVIADLMKSISVVEYTEGKNNRPDTLIEVARHFSTVWSTAVAVVDKTTFLESDADGNLLVLTRNEKGVTTDDQRRLEVTSDMQLGEIVNRIRKINVAPLPDAPVTPRAFLGTVEGSIYLFALIAPNRRNLLMELQSRMAQLVKTPGNVPFSKYRAFKNQVRASDEPFRFVDGELVEKYLDCDSKMQEKIIEGLDVNIDEMRGIIEGLRRLR